MHIHSRDLKKLLELAERLCRQYGTVCISRDNAFNQLVNIVFPYLETLMFVEGFVDECIRDPECFGKLVDCIAMATERAWEGIYIYSFDTEKLFRVVEELQRLDGNT